MICRRFYFLRGWTADLAKYVMGHVTDSAMLEAGPVRVYGFSGGFLIAIPLGQGQVPLVIRRTGKSVHVSRNDIQALMAALQASPRPEQIMMPDPRNRDVLRMARSLGVRIGPLNPPHEANDAIEIARIAADTGEVVIADPADYRIFAKRAEIRLDSMLRRVGVAGLVACAWQRTCRRWFLAEVAGARRNEYGRPLFERIAPTELAELDLPSGLRRVHVVTPHVHLPPAVMYRLWGALGRFVGEMGIGGVIQTELDPEGDHDAVVVLIRGEDIPRVSIHPVSAPIDRHRTPSIQPV